jgi:hypothetical protein
MNHSEAIDNSMNIKSEFYYYPSVSRLSIMLKHEPMHGGWWIRNSRGSIDRRSAGGAESRSWNRTLSGYAAMDHPISM